MKGSDNINQYLYKEKEEIIMKLRIVTGNRFDEYKNELQKIESENNYTYELIPFIDFLIDIILSGEDVSPDKLNYWWKLYSNTFEYNGELLKRVLNVFKKDLSNSLTKAFKVNIFTRFFRWIKNKIKTR